MATVIPFRALQEGSSFEGRLYEDAGASFILAGPPPGHGPALHRHPYAEVFIVQQGSARFTAGEETFEVTAGHVVVVPAETPHAFVNSGGDDLQMVNIHAAGKFDTEWIEER